MAVTLIASILCLSILPASVSASTTDTTSTEWRVPVGSFIQDYMTAGWSDARWQEELTAMKEAGMDILIFSPSLIVNQGSCRVNYPTRIPEYESGYIGVDCVDACLRNCEQAGVKVFIALNQDPQSGEGHFWNFGWHISTSQPDVLEQYWANNAKITNELADDLYGMYKSKYPNAFYGWYWVHEFWNFSIITRAYDGKPADDDTAADPTVYTDIIANDAFNPVLDHLTALDSSMPMLFSSFNNSGLCTSTAMCKMWTAIISKTHFRAGDIWAPMDGLGSGGISMNNLEEWTAAQKKASEANSNLHFWINNEEQIANQGDRVATIDRVVAQVTTTAKYAEQNVFFTWNHYYSPYNVLPGYNETYMQYVTTGKIEKNAPNAVDPGTITISKYSDGYLLKWKAPSDDVGVCEYNIYHNGALVTNVHPFRGDEGPKAGISLSAYVTDAGTYEIEAVDFAGNVSAKTAFNTDGTPVPTTTVAPDTTTTSPVSTTVNTETTVTQPADTTDASSTTVTDAGQTEQTTSQNPATGATLPKVALIFALTSAGLGLAVKAKNKNR